MDLSNKSLLSGMAKKYAALHLGNFNDNELRKAKDAKDRVKSKYLISEYFTDADKGFKKSPVDL